MFRKNNKKSDVSPAAHIIMKAGLIISLILLSLSLLIAVGAGDLNGDTYELYRLYSELYRQPQSILLITAIGALIVDDLVKR